jgi:selenide,water dikinase
MRLTAQGEQEEMTIDLFECVEECGCAAKVPADTLSRVLCKADIPTGPSVLVGPETLDDAGVFQLANGPCLVQTVDFFPPPSRDPRTYGRIAAANALSDVYAMGGAPKTALAVLCVPSSLASVEVIGEIISGASEKLREADCVLLGGHSVLDLQLKFGLSVTGIVDPKTMLTNSGAEPGDVLVLTKPLGIGATIMALRAGVASFRQEAEVNRVMEELNHKAAECALRCGARAATDITGFGLLGHALQLARSSGVALEIGISGIPFLEGAKGFAEQGLLSAATYSNRAYVGDEVHFDADIALADRDLLFDPQTSGGMLVCCPASQIEALSARMSADFSTSFGIVGRVCEHMSTEAIQSPIIQVQSRAFDISLQARRLHQ